MRWKRGNRLKLVSESEAPDRTRKILREVRESLGVPCVPKLYEAYAAFPKFLEVHWEAFRPVVHSRQFVVLGARLAAESYTRAHNYFDVPVLPQVEAGRRPVRTLSVSQVLDYYQYLDPLLLLIAAAQMRALEEGVGAPKGRVDAAVHPEFVAAPCLLGDAEAPPAVQRSWQERGRLLELAFISDEHRALACWGDFYLAYWVALKDLFASPVYADCQYRLAESALHMAGELPVRVETCISELIEAGLSDEEVAAVAGANELFVHALTGLVLDITFARIGVEKAASGAEPAAATDTKPETRHKKRTRSPIRAA